MKSRHAYLIMAHHRFDILRELLMDIDDERNDIFLHVDLKSKDYNPDEIKSFVRRANLFLTERMDIHWGGYQQIECVSMLLENAIKQGFHSYYHFMVGVEFPLKSQDYIHSFFNRNNGYEFIGFDNNDNKFLERVRYFHPFNSYARNNNFYQKILNKIRIACVEVQRLMNVDLVKKYNVTFKKGNANWSITHDLATIIVENKNIIEKIYRHSFCGDEVFIHTIVYNSPFWDRVYDKADEYHSSMRTMTWQDSHNQYHLKDLDYLLNCERLFARKIDGEDAIELINEIKQKRQE